jgi:hypothetical protein
MKEQIVLKRQEAQKAAQHERKKAHSGFSSSFDDAIDATPVSFKKPAEAMDELGRWGVRETIERARSTGESRVLSDLSVVLKRYAFY